MTEPQHEHTRFEELLEHLRDDRGFDFTGYKRRSLARRVEKRMYAVGAADHAAYLDHLRVHPDEVAQLFDTILINVTAFRRDPEHWDHLRDAVIVPLVEASRDGPIRVWSAGCSTGEEAYTLAMELCEQLGEEALRDRVRIYATDIDDDALETARRATYEERAVADLPGDWLPRYFRSSGPRFALRDSIRRSVVFGRHDIVQDAPISRIDLLVCRNLLMYFTPETQTRILSRLHLGLEDGAALFLGRAEVLLARSPLFVPVDLGHRVFRRAPDSTAQHGAPEPGSRPSRRPVELRTLLPVEDVSALERLQADLRRTNHELETAYEELLTSNEELQSILEELETTNQELQSTNEELETMNEELQSSHLEQDEVTNELDLRTRELDRSRELLTTVLASIGASIVVVDQHLRVQLWDETSTQTWGLQAHEVVGQPLQQLECGLPVAEIEPLAASTLSEGASHRVELAGTNRVGRAVTCDVRVTPSTSTAARRDAVIVVTVAPTSR